MGATGVVMWNTRPGRRGRIWTPLAGMENSGCWVDTVGLQTVRLRFVQTAIATIAGPCSSCLANSPPPPSPPLGMTQSY